MPRAFALAVPAALAALVFATAPAAAPTRPPVIKLSTRAFGNVLASRSRLPLYYWNVEKKAGGAIRCTGSGAKAWPAPVLRQGRRVPMCIARTRGRFGARPRADGRPQLAFRGPA